MVAIGEVHFRVGYLLVAVAVLLLLRKPLRYPERPGSRWLAVTVLALFGALGGVGLYYFVHSETGSILLFAGVMFAISLCFVGWLLIAIEFATGRSAPRALVAGLAGLLALHLLLLVTNVADLHELVYRSTTTIDESGALQRDVGPVYWVQVVIVYILAGLATSLFVSEWASASGLRRRQAGTLATALLPAFVVSVLWHLEVIAFPFDPTPAGAAVGVLVLTLALYRQEFIEVVPVGRQTVLEEMDDAVVILDDGDRVVDWNGAARGLFAPESPTVGMAATDFFETVPRQMREDLAGAGQTDREVTIERNGHEQHLSVTLTDIESDGGETVGRIVVVRDISARKRREQQLLEQNEYLDEFAGIVSHDLQGPLMEIRGNADRALRTGDLDHVEAVLEATDRMDRLVANLLELARSGQQIAETEPVALDGVASAAWRRVWTPSAELEVLDDRTVVADEERLQQLLENLFRNAVEHGSEGSMADGTGAGSVAPSRPGERVDQTGVGQMETQGEADGEATVALRVTVGAIPGGFYVEDDGTGIPPDVSEEIFDRGYTTTEDGSGLGLGIVRQIAGAHGWEVRVTDGDAGGARFEFTGIETEE